MKVSKKLIILTLIVVAFGLISLIPVYSKSVMGCKIRNLKTRNSLVLGSTKEDVDKEIEDFEKQNSVYDCPTYKTTFKLFIL